MDIITIKGRPYYTNDKNYKHNEEYISWFVDICPTCGENALLDNPKKSSEAMVTCKKCNTDYCGVTGKEIRGSGQLDKVGESILSFMYKFKKAIG